MSDFKNYCIETLSKVRPNSTFVSIRGYRNNFGEIADHNIIFKFRYDNLLLKSLDILRSGYILKENISNKDFSKTILKEGLEELIFSYEKSLSNYSLGHTYTDIYDLVKDVYGVSISGIKLHKKFNLLHMEGLSIRKNIIKKGSYPKRRSSEKTLAKNFIKSYLPINKFVQFKLIPEKFDRLVVNKLVIKGDL